jgi:DNA gyrase subunit B
VLEESLIKILIKFLVDSTVGVSVVNALSNPTATVHSGDGKVYQQEYEKEKRYTQLNKLVRLQKRNNSYFYPDETILLKQQIFI